MKIKNTILFIIGIFISLLFVIFIFRGIYLNLTLTEEYSMGNPSRGNFNIVKIKTDFSGKCDNTVFYPWQFPYGDCGVTEREMPFNFFYVKTWKGVPENPSQLPNSSGFSFIRNLFFKEKLILCFDNFLEPLNLKEEIYTSIGTGWGPDFSFSHIKGVKFTIKKLDDRQKTIWKKYIDNSMMTYDFSKKTRLIRGSSCEKYSQNDIIKEFNTLFMISHQLKKDDLNYTKTFNQYNRSNGSTR